MKFLTKRKQRRAEQTISNYLGALEELRKVYSVTKDNVRTQARGAEAESFHQKCLTANSELNIFMSDLLSQTIEEIVSRSNSLDDSFRSVATDLLMALSQHIPNAVLGRDYRVARYIKDGGTDLSVKAWYIQWNIANETGFGETMIQPVDHHVYTLCDEKLLHTLILTLMQMYPRVSQKEFNDGCQILSIAFTLYIQWSHQDGPFKRHVQKKF